MKKPVFIFLMLISLFSSYMTATAAEPVINKHVDSAAGTIVSDICNFSLQDLELPSVRINGKEVKLAFPDISIAKAIAFLTNFGGKALMQTSSVSDMGIGYKEAIFSSSELDKDKIEMEIDGKQIGDTLKSAAGGYINFWKRVGSGMDSDMSPIIESLNDYKINKNSLPYRMLGLDDESQRVENGATDIENDILVEEEE